MIDLLPRVARYVRRHGLLPAGEKVVVGVSGGPDSLCLLHLLVRLAPELRLHLHVSHLNHGLRGAEADADAAFVERLAADWGLACTVDRTDVRALWGRRGISGEEAARRARYAFLAQAARSVGAKTVAVAHHADDQAETVLMHFLRGSGVAGLCGMRPVTHRCQAGHSGPECEESVDRAPRAAGDLRLVRPLLCASRAEIESYCEAHALQPRFDRSNEDTAFHRNRLRHHLLPLLETYNPAIRQVLARTAELMSGEHDVLQAELGRAWDRCAVAGAPGEVRFDLRAWRALPVAMQRATLREAVRRVRSGLRDLGWEHVERAVELGRSGSVGQSATLIGGLALQVGYDALRVAAEGAPWPAAVPQVDGLLPLAAPGLTALGGRWRVRVEQLDGPAPASEAVGLREPWTALLDSDRAGCELLLRPRRPGDRMQPQGMAGHSVRVNELMINAKAPRSARARWPLLVGRTGIAWACGLRVDERVAVGPETTSAWRVCFEASGPSGSERLETGGSGKHDG